MLPGTMWTPSGKLGASGAAVIGIRLLEINVAVAAVRTIRKASNELTTRLDLFMVRIRRAKNAPPDLNPDDDHGARPRAGLSSLGANDLCVPLYNVVRKVGVERLPAIKIEPVSGPRTIHANAS